MEEIKINPFEPITTTKFGGYVGENKAYAIVVEGITGKNNEIWLTDNQKNFMKIPIPDNRFELTSFFTKEPKIWSAIIVEKTPENGTLKKGHGFGISIEPSIGMPNMIEILPPFLENLSNQLEILLKEVDRKLQSGELTGKTPDIEIGTVKTVNASQPAKVTRKGTKENPVFDFEIPQGVKGNVYYPTFEVVGNELFMTGSDEENLRFKINEAGEMEVIANEI